MFMRSGVGATFVAFMALTGFFKPAFCAAESRVLLIGDSHTVGEFGRTLDQKLREARLIVESHARFGATGDWYFTGETLGAGVKGFDREARASAGTYAVQAKTPKLGELLARTRADYTVIALGSNSEWRDSKIIRAELERVMRKVRSAGSQCLWVAPPDMASVPSKDRERFYVLLREVASRESCAVIDSYAIAGVHPTCQGTSGPCDPVHWDAYPERARAWGEAVSRQVISAMAVARAEPKAAPGGVSNGPSTDAPVITPGMPGAGAARE